MPTSETTSTPMRMPPATRREVSATISTRPMRQRMAGHCVRSPSVTSMAGLATTIFACSSAMMPRKSPTPAEMASLRFPGMALMTYSRMRNTDRMKKRTPEQNTAAGQGLLPAIFIGQYDRECEKGIEPHARRERDRIVGVERHHQRGHRRRDASRDEHGALV